MKNKKLILWWFLFPVQLVCAQSPVHLSDCQQWAREQHPFLKQEELYRKMSELNLANNSADYLPQVILNVQATYQSDVTHLGVSLPGVSIPSVSKDQYKAYLDVKQNIWNGGRTRAGDLLEQAQDQVNRQNVEVELYQVKDQVNNLFFSCFLLQENLNVLGKKQETLQAQQSMMESGVRNGLLLQSDLDQIMAELIRVKQQKIEIQSDRQSALSALSILTGKSMEDLGDLVLDSPDISLDGQIQRPELDLFEKQTELLDATSNQIGKKRNPNVFGFGQAGYGRPGLNMLNDEFGTYYLVGVGMNWSVFDWKNTKREKEVVRLRQEMVQTQQQQFERNIRIALDGKYRKIHQLQAILESDRELITIQERITKSSASKLENGTITTSDYIQDLNAEMTARITFETHHVQLEAARVDYLDIQGN